MADTIIVYYSLEGNVDFLARELAGELGADVFRLETVKEYPKKGLAKFFHGGKDAVTSSRPELKAAVPSLAAYSTVVIGTPVWASRPAPPLNTFLFGADLAGKRVGLFASSAGGNARKCLSAMREAVAEARGQVVAEEDFTNPLKAPEEAAARAKAFAQRLRG